VIKDSKLNYCLRKVSVQYTTSAALLSNTISKDQFCLNYLQVTYT